MSPMLVLLITVSNQEILLSNSVETTKYYWNPNTDCIKIAKLLLASKGISVLNFNDFRFVDIFVGFYCKLILEDVFWSAFAFFIFLL